MHNKVIVVSTLLITKRHSLILSTSGTLVVSAKPSKVNNKFCIMYLVDCFNRKIEFETIKFENMQNFSSGEYT